MVTSAFPTSVGRPCQRITPVSSSPQHTFVSPVLFGEMLLQPHMYPRAKHALAALTVVGVSYLSW